MQICRNAWGISARGRAHRPTVRPFAKGAVAEVVIRREAPGRDSSSSSSHPTPHDCLTPSRAPTDYSVARSSYLSLHIMLSEVEAIAQECAEAIHEMIRAHIERKRRRTAAAKPRINFGDLPVEVAHNVFHNADEKSLARLASTSRRLRDETEQHRFKDITAWSPRGLYSLHDALTSPVVDGRGRTRVQRVQTLTVSWARSSLALPITHAHIEWLLGLVGRHLSRLAKDPPRLSLDAVAHLNFLVASSAVMRCIECPPRQLTCLTVDRVWAHDVSVFVYISNTFGNTLRRLRVIRGFQSSFSRQSPMRICAALVDCRALEYLEVCDYGLSEVRRSPSPELRAVRLIAYAQGGPTGLDQLDNLTDTPFIYMAAADGVPALETLVWQPAWGAAYASDWDAFVQNVAEYSRQFKVLDDPSQPLSVHFCLSPDTKIEVTSEDQRGPVQARLIARTPAERWDSLPVDNTSAQ
ncbi:hypothetical protein C8T65DRAFT_651759 [Cerioporus squamosus]|nr:hypothetical protein C8T65DRAFT_651759 [Cerioporus squamosus]